MASRASRTVTRLEVQQHDNNRVSIFVDGTFAFGVHRSLVIKHGLSEGQVLTEEKEDALKNDESVVQAKQTALRYLAHKPRTEQEVRQKLQQKEVAPSIIGHVLKRMHDLGYVDDATYAEDYVRNRFASKRYGPRRIQRELIKRGIDRDQAEQAVARFFQDHDPLEAARSHAEKRWPRISRDDNPQRRKQKLYRYLARRGFTSDTIYRVLDEFVGF